VPHDFKEQLRQAEAAPTERKLITAPIDLSPTYSVREYVGPDGDAKPKVDPGTGKVLTLSLADTASLEPLAQSAETDWFTASFGSSRDLYTRQTDSTHSASSSLSSGYATNPNISQTNSQLQPNAQEFRFNTAPSFTTPTHTLGSVGPTQFNYSRTLFSAPVPMRQPAIYPMVGYSYGFQTDAFNNQVWPSFTPVFNKKVQPTAPTQLCECAVIWQISMCH